MMCPEEVHHVGAYALLAAEGGGVRIERAEPGGVLPPSATELSHHDLVDQTSGQL